MKYIDNNFLTECELIHKIENTEPYMQDFIDFCYERHRDNKNILTAIVKWRLKVNEKLKEENIDYNDFFVTPEKTVKDVVNFNWIYDRLTKDNILTICTKNCHKTESIVQEANQENKNIKA
mgnify:CR=1 FL=1